MANIRFVKAPNDNRVRPSPGAAKADLNYNSSNTRDISVHASAQRCDNVASRTKPNNDSKSAAPRNLFVTSNNNNNDEVMPSPVSRVTTSITKKDDRDNKHTETSCTVSRSHSSREGLSASTMEESGNEKEQCFRVNETIKHAAEKFEHNVTSRTGGGESNKSAKTKLEDTKRKRDDNELNVVQMKSAKDAQSVPTKTDRKHNKSDLLPDISKSGDLISQSGTQQLQQQEQQQQKRQEEKQSYPSQSHQIVNRQISVSTAQQSQPQSGNRPLYRSISNAEIIDEPSFFRSISDVKYYGLDSDDTETLNVAENSKEKKILQEATCGKIPNPQRSEVTKTARQDKTPKFGLDSNLKNKAENKAEGESPFNEKKSETIKQHKRHSSEEMKLGSIQETKAVRQDVVSKSGLDSNSKSTTGNDSTFNVGKSETVKQNKVLLPEEKKASMQQEKKTDMLEASTASTLGVVRNKISEAVKTGFKKFDNLEEKDGNDLKNKKVNTTAEKTDDIFHEITSNSSSGPHIRVPPERNSIATHNKMSPEKNESMIHSKKSSDTVGVKQDQINDNFGVTSRKVTEDKKLDVAQGKILGEKRADETQHKILEDKITLSQGTIVENKKLGVNQSKLDTTQSEVLDNRSLRVPKTNVLDEENCGLSNDKKTKILGDNKSIRDNNMLDGAKHKLSEERRLGMIKRSTIEENMCAILKEKDVYTLADNKIGMFEGNKSSAQGIMQVHIPVNKTLPGTQGTTSTEKHFVLTQDKIYEEQTRGKPLDAKKSGTAQGIMSEERTLDLTQSKPLDEKTLSVHGNTPKEKKLVKTQSKILEEKKLAENKMSEDKKLVTMQTKISEDKNTDITQSKMSGDKQLDLTQNEMSKEKQEVATQGKIENKQIVVMPSKIAEEKKRGASHGKISEERILNAKQTEILEQNKVGVPQGNISEERKFGTMLDKIPEEKNLGVLQAKGNIMNKISEDKTTVQGKMSENKKMLTRCEMPQDKQCNMSEETKCQTNISGEKCHNSKDYKNTAVGPEYKSEDKKVRETTDKKLEDKKLRETTDKKTEDKKVGAKTSKLDEKKLKEEKLRDSKDSNHNLERNKIAEVKKSDSVEGAKVKTGKRKGSIKLEASKSHILNETTTKILEQRKNAYKQKLLDEECNATGQKKTATKEVQQDTGSQKSNLASDQDITMSSAALDAMTAEDRMKMRRSALSDPEKMIMSQERREKIEKDVGKKKTSVARKVTQFVSAQLGLSNDEDLN